MVNLLPLQNDLACGHGLNEGKCVTALPPRAAPLAPEVPVHRLCKPPVLPQSHAFTLSPPCLQALLDGIAQQIRKKPQDPSSFTRYMFCRVILIQVTRSMKKTLAWI